MSEGLREVTVNGVRYFQADDVERWHRGNVAKAEEWEALSERVERFEEALRLIAESYPWIAYSDDETIHDDVWRARDSVEPTNREGGSRCLTPGLRAKLRCPGCRPGECGCRGEQLRLGEGFDDEGEVVVGRLELGLDDVDDAEGAAGPARDYVAGGPDHLADPDRVDGVAVLVDEEECSHPATVAVDEIPVERGKVLYVAEGSDGRRTWIIRLAEEEARAEPAPAAPARKERHRAGRVTWHLVGGPCAGSYPVDVAPTETIRAVHGGPDGPAVLDLPGDVVEEWETVEVYELESSGHLCGRPGGCEVYATFFPASFTEAERSDARRAEFYAARASIRVPPPSVMLEQARAAVGLR